MLLCGDLLSAILQQLDHNPCLSKIQYPSSSYLYLSLISMKNSNDKKKKKKKKPAKNQPAKTDAPEKAKHARKLTSKATSCKNHLQDDIDREAVSSDNEGDDQKEDIESVLCSQ